MNDAVIAVPAALERQRLRLWGSSALTVVLAHVAAMALLFQHIHERPAPLAGSPVALDVELASPPSLEESFNASSPRQAPLQSRQAQQAQPSSRRPQLATPASVRPLAEMQPLAQASVPMPSNAAPPTDAGATNAPVGSSDLGASNASVQLWAEEVKARLQSYKDYPSSAMKELQQDNVTLQLSVDHTGHVTYSRVDSTHHYQALEQEVQQMLRLAGSLPTPPPQLADDVVLTVPVQFALNFMPDIHCGGSGCPTVRGAQSKLKAVAPPPPTLASCTAPASPGPAPTGSTATLEQMRAYQERLSQYVAAGGNQLACLSQVREAPTLALRDTLTRQLHSMVDEFNAEARTFEAKAQAQALQAQQALAARIYAACTPPMAPRAPVPALTAESAQTYRQQLVSYQSAVRTYVACLRQADLGATAPQGALASDQRAQLNQTAAQLGNAAVQSFNQNIGKFNSQVARLRQQALADQAQNLAEVLVQGTAIFPSSAWSVPAPLPADECIYITRFGQNYHAGLCNPTYVTRASGLAQLLRNDKPVSNGNVGDEQSRIATNVQADALEGLPAAATQQEAIMALHGFPSSAPCGLPPCGLPILGIAVTVQQGTSQQVQQAAETPGPRTQITSYNVSDLKVAGRHISLTISQRDRTEGNDSVSLGAIHFDLALSPDNQTLYGYCSTDQRRWKCALPLHH